MEPSETILRVRVAGFINWERFHVWLFCYFHLHAVNEFSCLLAI